MDAFRYEPRLEKNVLPGDISLLGQARLPLPSSKGGLACIGQGNWPWLQVTFPVPVCQTPGMRTQYRKLTRILQDISAEVPYPGPPRS